MTGNPLHTGKKILVADDNPVILKAIFTVLMANGYETTIALDCGEALESVRRQKPDLILLDIFFPPHVGEGGVVWDGFTILDWLQKADETARIPVIVISSADSNKYQDRCIAAGALAFFSKPIDTKKLIETIRSTLGVPLPKVLA